jgi:uracil-DNA glycosylase
MVERPDESVERELWQLTRQVRAALEWLADSGVEDLPGTDSPEQLLRLFALDRPAQRQARPQAARPAQLASPRPVGRPPHGQRPGASPSARAPSPPQQQAPSDKGQPQHESGQSPQAPAAAAKAKSQPAIRLPQLANEVAECTRCPLHEGRTNTVFARGNPAAKLMFIGEGPGFNEDQQGLPFVGKAGQLLDKMIAAMGFAPTDVYIANVVKCRPPNNRKPSESEIADCAPYLREQIELVQPRMIVALGATGIQGLLGTQLGITRLRGQWKLYDGRIPIMPTFHPAYLLRQPEKKREVWSDLKQVMNKLGTLPKARS